METYLTIEGVAGHLKLSAQTIRRYVLNREIPFHKIKKVIRFRLSEIEEWIDGGGLDGRVTSGSENDQDGDLFAGVEAAETGGADGETGEVAAEAGKNTEAGGAAASDGETGGAA
jgi:excisionase family DNA binding protein